MPWLLPKSITPEADQLLERWLGELTERLADPATDRNALVAAVLSEVLYARPYEELQETAPLAAVALDPRNVTFEAEYYEVAAGAPVADRGDRPREVRARQSAPLALEDTRPHAPGAVHPLRGADPPGARALHL